MFRFAILDMGGPSYISLTSMAVFIVTLVITGFTLFWKTEMKIVDQA
jgi:hypothetical protein